MSHVDLTIAGKRPPETGSARLILTLTIAALLAGLALASAYVVTRPMIEANHARALRRAVFEVVPGSKVMRRLALRDGKLVAAEGPAKGEPSVYAAYDAEGRFAGWAIEAEGSGFQDTIRLLIGLDPPRAHVIGMVVLDSRETPGLGDKIIRDARFHKNFTHLAIKPQVVLVKGGRHADNEVDAITGATISSRSVVKIVNAALEQWVPVLLPADQVPPAPAASNVKKGG